MRLALPVLALAGACGDDAMHHLADAPIAIDTAPAIDAPTCAAQTCGGACVDTATDPDNCGACGHACGCGSTTCTAGRCDPHVLADAQGSPVALARDPATNTLYWGDDGAMRLEKLALPDGAATTLYPGRTAIRGFAFDATRIYFSRAAFNIMESGTLAGDSSGNFTNQQEAGAWGVATDGVNVYWATAGSGNLRERPTGAPGTSGGTTLAAGRTTPRSVAVDATTLYWTEGATAGAVMRLLKAGGTATALATGQDNPVALAIDATDVYWTVAGTGGNTGAVRRVPLAGGTVESVAEGLPSPSAIALDTGYVYWTDVVAGAVLRAPLAGGEAPVAIASGETSPLGLVVANACVYWTDNDPTAGSVRSHDATP